MQLQHFIDNFAIPGALAFEQTEHGLVRGKITTAACTAEIYFQGAHLTQWHPVGHKNVLFLSDRSAFLPGKAIRGGIPLIFPWFGARTANRYSSRTDGPSHGFARTSEWQLTSATISGDNLELALTLEATSKTSSLGFDAFLVTYKLSIGTELDLQLTVENKSKNTLLFEEALHSYFMVGDAQTITIDGLKDTDYVDKTDDFKRKRQTESSLILTGETDRPYLETEASIDLNDRELKRKITISKANSKNTVVWNPWAELTSNLADMSPDGWKQMTCIETANVGERAVTLPPGKEHTMHAHIVVKELS